MELKLAEFEYDDSRPCCECSSANSYVVMRFENVVLPFCLDCFKEHVRKSREFLNGEKSRCWWCSHYVMDPAAGCHVCAKGCLREIGTDVFADPEYEKCSFYSFKGNG